MRVEYRTVRAEYRVACGSQLEVLIAEVNALLRMGFVLVGGMVIEKPVAEDRHPDVVWFYQPLYRPASSVAVPISEEP